MSQELLEYLARQTERAFEIQSVLTAVPAIGPENGGQGESEKAAVVESLLAACGVTDIMRLNSPDPRVASGQRPNIIARMPGNSPRTLWLFGHLDVVPPGQGWDTDPWHVHRNGDIIYGRGVEDNQQAVTCMLLLAESVHNLAITPSLSIGLVFMADEECGSRHGLGYILKQAPEFFGRDDLYIVPDGGSADAASIEIAEKAQLWLKFTVHGRQCHASVPQNGVNALVLASRLIARLADLEAAFPARDSLFTPSCSTFIPTRHDGNGPAINILPGKDSFYMDCRLLPQVDPDEVQNKVQTLASDIIDGVQGSIEIEVEHFQSATETPPDAPVVRGLLDAVAAVYGVQGRPCGIGGATVAALLRNAGLPAAVWACLENTCHQPNERSSLTATCKDAAVFAWLLMNGPRNA